MTFKVSRAGQFCLLRELCGRLINQWGLIDTALEARLDWTILVEIINYHAAIILYQFVS